MAAMAAPSVLRRAWTRDAAAVAVYLALGFVLFWPVWSAGAATHMQVGGDQWRNVWFDQWTVHAIAHGHNILYSNAVNYPGGVNVLINAGAPLLGVVFSPITVIFGPIATYNLTSTLALPLAAMAAYLLLRRLVRWRMAAFVGGLLYGFGPEEVVHGLGGHVNLSFTCLIPLIVLCVYEIVSGRGERPWLWGIALGLLVTAQFFVSSEVLLETVVVCAVAVVVAALLSTAEVRSRIRRGVTGLFPGAALALVLLAWPAWFLAKGPGHVSGPVQLVAQAYRANLLAPLVPDSLQLITFGSLTHTADHFASATVENGSYLGIPIVVLLLAGLVWLRREKAVLVAGLSGIAAFILSMGAAMSIRATPALNSSGGASGKVPLPETILYKLPLLENLIPSRFALQVALFAAIVGALLLDRFHERLLDGGWRPWMPSAIPMLIAAVALVALLPTGLLGGVAPDVTPAGFDHVASKVPENSVAVVFPFASGTDPEPIMWQADADMRFRMPGGSLFVPQGPAQHVAHNAVLGYTFDSVTGEDLTDLALGQPPPQTPDTRAALSFEWKSWHVKSVLAVPSACPYPGQAMSFLTWLLGPPNLHSGATYGWLGVNPGGG